MSHRVSSQTLIVVDPDTPANWSLVSRGGQRRNILLTEDLALNYADSAAQEFGVGKSQRLEFNKDLAKKDLDGGTPKSSKKNEGN